MVISVRLWACAAPSVSSATVLAMRLGRNLEWFWLQQENGEKSAMTFFLQRNGRSAGWERDAAETGRRSFDKLPCARITSIRFKGTFSVEDLTDFNTPSGCHTDLEVWQSNFTGDNHGSAQKVECPM
jgi:hypothetical protein